MKYALSRTDGPPISLSSHRIQTIGCSVLLILLLLWAYEPSWAIAPHADDLMLLVSARLGVLGGAYQGTVFFRPLELLTVELGAWLGNPSGASKLVNFAGLLAATAILFRLAQRLQPTERALPFVVAALFACHPMNVAPISQMDMVSQQLTTLTVLGALLWYVLGPRDRPTIYHTAGAGLLVLALLSKEAAVGAVFALPVALAVFDLLERRAPLAPLLRRAVLMLVAVSGLFLAYLALRAWAGAGLSPVDGSENYVLSIDPLRVIKNMVLLLGSAAYLGSSLDIFLGGGPRILPVVFATLLNGLALLGFVVVLHALRAGSMERREFALAAAAGVMLLGSMFPVSLTGRVSESHSYLPLPFYLLVTTYFAFHGGRTLQRCWRLPARPLAALGMMAVVICCAWMLGAVREKLAYSTLAGARSEAFRAQMEQWYAQTPVPASVPTACLVQRDGDAAAALHYSVFIMQDYSLLQPMMHWLNYRYGPRLHMPYSPAPQDQCGAFIEVDGERLRLALASPSS